MEQIPAQLQLFVWELGGAFGIGTALLLAALVVLLPRDKRKLLRRPLLLFFMYLVLVALSYAAWVMETHVVWLRVGAVAAVLVVLTRAVILFATETRVGRRMLPPVPRIFIDVFQGLMLALVGLLTLYAAGLEPGELLATSAILTAVLGLALQDTLSNLFSGLALQLVQHFEVGDWIEFDTATPAGRVIEIGWRATKLVTLDEFEIVVPNGIIAKSVMRNHSRPTPVERRTLSFSAPYAVPPGTVRAVVLPALAAVPRVLHSPEPSLLTTSFGDSSVHYSLRYFTDDYRTSQLTDALVRDRVWYAMARAGIQMPFPQREVHVRREGRAERESAVASALAERVAVLGQVPFLQVLGEASQARIASTSREYLFTAGEEIVRQGDTGADLYVIVNGTVSVSIDGNDVARLGPGACFGEMSLLTGEPRAATVVAVEDVRTIAVAPDALRPDLEGDTVLCAKLGTVLAERQIEIEALAERHRGTPRALEERAGKLLERIRAFFPG